MGGREAKGLGEIVEGGLPFAVLEEKFAALEVKGAVGGGMGDGYGEGLDAFVRAAVGEDDAGTKQGESKDKGWRKAEIG